MSFMKNILRGLGMSKNKTAKTSDKSKNASKKASKDKSKANAKKSASPKSKTEAKKTASPTSKSSSKNKAPSNKVAKKTAAKSETSSKKIKEDKSLKNKKSDKKSLETSGAAKSKAQGKEAGAPSTNSKKSADKTSATAKKVTRDDAKNAKGSKKKSEKEENIKAKGNKGSRSDKDKSDADFNEGFDDFEMDGDEILDDTDFDPEVLLEEEAKKNKKTKKIIDDEIREQLAEEIINLSEEYGLVDVLQAIKSLEFFSSDNIDCTEKACDNPTTTQGYCRYHYIKRWKDIKKKQIILEEGKLQNLIEDLISKHPFKYIEAILNDLMDEKTFSSVLRELNIDMTSDEGFDDVGDDEMEEEDIAFETKVTAKVAFDED